MNLPPFTHSLHGLQPQLGQKRSAGDSGGRSDEISPRNKRIRQAQEAAGGTTNSQDQTAGAAVVAAAAGAAAAAAAAPPGGEMLPIREQV